MTAGNMLGIKFIYLYRDGSNYKKWAHLVFSNPEKTHVDIIERTLRDAFLPDGLFIAHQIRLPEVFLSDEDHVTPDDHCFHEFDSIELTSDVPSDQFLRTARDFMREAAKAAGLGWKAFELNDRPSRKDS